MTVLVCMLQCNVFGVAVVICVETFALLACTALMQFAVHALFHCAMLLLSDQLGRHRQQEATRTFTNNPAKHKERKKEKRKNTKQPKNRVSWVACAVFPLGAVTIAKPSRHSPSQMRRRESNQNWRQHTALLHAAKFCTKPWPC